MVNSSWENVEKWYDKTVGEKGHYYHQEIILPGVLRLLDLKKIRNPKLLDLACGQGVLSRNLPKHVAYTGIDNSSSLIAKAKRYSNDQQNTRFLTGDISQPLALETNYFNCATIILALQNVADPLSVLKNCQIHLQAKAKLIIILNHPCFRIPRQSSWQIDSQKKLQYRRIDRYFSPLVIPIQTHPSHKESSPQTTSYHFPLSSYSMWLKQCGFTLDLIDEWCSNKKSTGSTARMENMCRQEFPLFLALSAIKN